MNETNAQNVFACIVSSYQFNGTLPTPRQVANELNMSITSAYRAFRQLRKMGYIQNGVKYQSYVITRERWVG